jgi:excisionase family DNA binding protein
MRGLGKFQLAQMKAGDPRVPQLFRVLRDALDLLEEISLHPHQAAPSPPDPVPAKIPAAAPIDKHSEKLAYSIKEIRTLTGISNTKIYTEIQQGRLRTSKSGRRTLILAKDLQAWVDGWKT